MLGALGSVPRLSDGVVTLRAPRDSDLPDVVEQCQDPETQRWTTVPVPYTRDDAARFVRHVIPDGWRTDREWAFAVEAVDDTGTARFGGTVSLRDLGGDRAEIAYGAHPWIRGRGLMERALRLLVEWGYAERGLRTISWQAVRGNWSSRRLAWRLGFSCDGVLRSWISIRGELHDAWVGTLHPGEPLEPRTDWLRTPTITGAAVVLRAATDADVPRLVAALADPVLQRYSQSIREHAPHDEASVRARELDHLELAAQGSALTWTVADAGDDTFLGTATLSRIHDGHAAEVGYWVHPDARGRGVATEACRLVVRHAVVDREEGGLGLHRVAAYASSENLASQRVLERSGFTRFGTERLSTLLPDGSLVDTAAYDRLAADDVERPGRGPGH